MRFKKSFANMSIRQIIISIFLLHNIWADIIQSLWVKCQQLGTLVSYLEMILLLKVKSSLYLLKHLLIYLSEMLLRSHFYANPVVSGVEYLHID